MEESARFAELAGRLRSGERVLPTQLALETVCGCNARCIMCPSRGMRRQKGVMTRAMHRILADKVADCGAPITLISHAGMGEPLRDETLAEKIAYEKQRFPEAAVAVYTNGSLLDAEAARRLVDSGVDIVSVSLNAFRAETYAGVMGLPRERTYANVEAFRDLLAGLPGQRPQLHVSLVRTELCGEAEVDEFVDHWTPLADAVLLPPFITWGAGPELAPVLGRFSCVYLWKVLMVDFDGTVKPCCEDFDSSVVFGNLFAQDPLDVFNCEAAQRMRMAQLEGDFFRPGMCAGCVETLEPAREWWRNASPVFESPGQEPVVGEAGPEGFKRRLAATLATGLTENEFAYPQGGWPPPTPARVYIAEFLTRYVDQVRGRCVEFYPSYYREMFPGADSYGVWNLMPTEGVTVVADVLDAVSVPDASFDAIICTHVLSAVSDVSRAVAELWRVLAPGGLLLCTVPCVLQGYAPNPADHWRFTRDSLAGAFSSFSRSEIFAYGNAATAAGSMYYLMDHHFPAGVLEAHDPGCPSILGLAAWK